MGVLLVLIEFGSLWFLELWVIGLWLKLCCFWLLVKFLLVFVLVMCIFWFGENDVVVSFIFKV